MSRQRQHLDVRSLLGAAVLLAFLAAGCQAVAVTPVASAPAATVAAVEQPAPAVTEPAPDSDAAEADQDAASQEALGLTNQRLDGNHVVDGYADLSQITPIDVELDGVPAWIAAVPAESGVVWAVALDDGRTQAFHVADGAVTPVPTEPAELPAGMPPLVRWADGVARFIMPSGSFSPLTNAVPVGDGLAYIDVEGNLVIDGADTMTVLEVDALPDARILVDEQERLLLLTEPTGRYGHGVLGDKLEAASITLVETQPEPRVVQVIQIPEPRVVEGIAPIWADLDGDGAREIVVTLSDAANGAQVVAYGEDGAVVAEGPAIGQGSRWRHQLAVAPFGPQGQIELVDVLTPHLGGVVEFYTMQDGRLDIVARLPGFTSHVIGTRNMDMAVAAAPAGNEPAVLLIPNQDRTQLGAIRHGDVGAEAAWVVDAGGTIVTNVAAASLEDGQIGVAVGRSDGALRIWQPD